MTAIYWPEELRCEPDICVQPMVHLHCRTDLAACHAFHAMRNVLGRSRGWPGGSLIGPPANVRNVCVTGPDGRLLREVLYSAQEIARAVEAQL